MPSDASIYGLMREPKPLPGPADQMGQILNLKALMTQNRVGELQAQDTEQTLGEKNAFREGLRGLAPGESLEAAIPRLMQVAPQQAIALQQQLLQQKQLTGSIAHTAAQTGEITAGHIAGAMAAIAKGGGSDESVKAAHDMMLPLVGEARASQVTQQLLAMPPEMRLPYVTAQAGAHKTGQEALKLFFPQAHMQDTGGQITPVSTATLPGGPVPGTPIPGGAPITKTLTPGERQTGLHQKAQELHNALSLKETTRHHAALEGDPAVIEETAKAIASGQLAPLFGFALARPMAQNIMARVVQINPEFDPTQFATRQKAEKDFATGKQGTSVKSFNVAISHLGTLDQLADALHNGNSQLVNKIGNVISTQTGGTAPTNFEAAKKIVGDEIVKAIVGSGGGVADREEAAKTIAAANSPAQLKGVISTYKELMKGQLDGLRKQYEATTGKQDFDKKFLSEDARGVAHAPAAPRQEVAKPGKLVPAKGAVQDGYRFKGGDPAKPESWEKV